MHCCGLESVIPDVGVLYAVKKMKSQKKDISFFFKASGSLSGGTWASLSMLFIQIKFQNQ